MKLRLSLPLSLAVISLGLAILGWPTPVRAANSIAYTATSCRSGDYRMLDAAQFGAEFDGKIVCLQLASDNSAYVLTNAPSGNCPAKKVDSRGAVDAVSKVQKGSGSKKCFYAVNNQIDFSRVEANPDAPDNAPPPFSLENVKNPNPNSISTGCPKTATPGLDLNCTNNKNPIYALLQKVINWSIRVLGVLAVLAVVVSGIQYIISQGNPDGVKSAKSRLTNAIIGLVLLALMFVILRFLGVT
jgi:hypothetical protein